MLKKTSAAAGQGFNFQEFDREWTNLGIEICQAIYTNPKSQKLKESLQKKGFLSLEEKSEFINISNTTKYKVIYKKYGQAGTPGYKQFSQFWEEWFQEKGVESQRNRRQHNSVDHILFGSTPDPIEFLLHFEEEIMGSYKRT